MNQLTPAIIAKQDDVVVGYVLATDKSQLSYHPLLNDLSCQINKISFKKKTIGDFNYLVVGQLCVAKEFRGKGSLNSFTFILRKFTKIVILLQLRM